MVQQVIRKLSSKSARLNSNVFFLLSLFYQPSKSAINFSPEQTRLKGKSLESLIDFPSDLFISIFLAASQQVWPVRSLALLEFNVGVCNRLLEFRHFYLDIVFVCLVSWDSGVAFSYLFPAPM